MQRRNLFGMAGFLAFPALAQEPTPAPAPPPIPKKPIPMPKDATLTVRWLGHTCFLFTSKESRILVNPFRAIPCTKGYQKPAVDADLVLLSSRLFDEGAIDVVPGNPKVLLQPGVYDVDGLKIQGIRTDHDNKEGRRFGVNVVWRWVQGGINIVHLGGLAAPLTGEQKILIGQADIVFVPVGGGIKAINSAQALTTIKELNPKIIVPTHYRTAAATPDCDITTAEEFLKGFPKEIVQSYPGSVISFTPQILPKTLQVRTFTYTNFTKETRLS